MRRELFPDMERARCSMSGHFDDLGSGPQGAFKISGPRGMELRIVASDGRDWAEAGLPPPVWEHVSVSLARRCPDWSEMEWVREQFWEPAELVLQFSVPRAVHISYHPYCLHMWRPIGVEVPVPPSATVAPVEAERKQ